MENNESRLRKFYQENKSILSVGFLLALVSAFIGVAFSFGVSQGEKFAIGEIKDLENRVEALESANEDIISIQEVGTYLANRNNVEALERIDKIIEGDPYDGVRFLALEMKARILIRHGGGKFDDEVRSIGAKMIREYPESYNGYHWRGLANFRITMRRYALQHSLGIDNLPLNTIKLHSSLSDFNHSISKFEDQIKDRINKVEVLIVLGEYDQALYEILDAKDGVHLKEDFHVLILDYLEIICKIFKEEPIAALKNDLLHRIENLPRKVAFNYTSQELEAAFMDPAYVVFKSKIDEIINEIKDLNDPDVE